MHLYQKEVELLLREFDSIKPLNTSIMENDDKPLLEMIGESSDQELIHIIDHINMNLLQDPNTDPITAIVLKELITDIQTELISRTVAY